MLDGRYVEQGFGRDASDIGAYASDPVLLYQHCLEAELRGPDGCSISAWPCPYDRDIDFGR
jgi:hypothetical protein